MVTCCKCEVAKQKEAIRHATMGPKADSNKMPKGGKYQAVHMCLLEKKEGLAVRPSAEEERNLAPDPTLLTLRQL